MNSTDTLEDMVKKVLNRLEYLKVVAREVEEEQKNAPMYETVTRGCIEMWDQEMAEITVIVMKIERQNPDLDFTKLKQYHDKIINYFFRQVYPALMAKRIVAESEDAQWIIKRAKERTEKKNK